jgi:hypothetical protein
MIPSFKLCRLVRVYSDEIGSEEEFVMDLEASVLLGEDKHHFHASNLNNFATDKSMPMSPSKMPIVNSDAISTVNHNVP